MIEKAVVRNGAYVSITSSEPVEISGFTGRLPEGTERPASVSYKSPLPSRLGLQVPASVSHAVQAFDLSQIGVKPDGSISVAANILSLAYLWNEIRVKGGAYGTSVSANRTGSYLCYSYRDPSPERSLGIYATLGDYIEAYGSVSQSDIAGFIISTIASTEPLVSPAAKGRSADDFWFSGFSDEDRIRIRSEIIDTTPADLAKWSESFRALARDGSTCVIGPKSALDKCDDLEIISI